MKNFLRKLFKTRVMITLGAIFLVIGKILLSLVVTLLFGLYESFIGQFWSIDPNNTWPWQDKQRD